MLMKLVFKKIENKNIFTRDFNPLVSNNTIDFENKNKIAVVYGPNGTGKTSLIKVLGDGDKTKVEFSLNDTPYTSGKDVFHIINDQNNRNIISGETKEFLLGDNIRHEFELQEIIASERKKLLGEINSLLKNKFSISTISNPLIKLIKNNKVSELVKDCANSRSKGGAHSDEKLISILDELKETKIPEYNESQMVFWIKDYTDKNAIIPQILSLIKGEIIATPSIVTIEEDTVAIDVLNRFHKDICIVCDHSINNREELLQNKTQNCKKTIASLEPHIQEMINKLIPLVPSEDPFNIKGILIDYLATANKDKLLDFNKELSFYQNVFNLLLENDLYNIFNKSSIKDNYNEYQKIISEKPDITDEDYLYIQEIIGNSMNKKLIVERDNNKQLKIRLEGQDFLDQPREELPLSNGEQNFLSLTFEFLKAKNSSLPIVVIDDPISSFDSIYKNKVVYAIVRMLQSKKRIVLTHNIDFIRLLDSQYRNSFNLYILNNTEDETNGFIQLKTKEQGMLISLQKLLDAFRGDVLSQIVNKELFLISMIPFMRGYANIINRQDLFEQLTQVMHGYKNQKIDIAQIYRNLFNINSEAIPESYEVSVEDILEKTVDGKHIVNPQEYPLLDKTLYHSFVYLFLRLILEKKLVEKFNINTDTNEQLGQIISAAFPNDNDIEQIRKRIRLTSKKTLINEFNHFEGNLSIFQPAIDITNKALETEKVSILGFVREL